MAILILGVDPGSRVTGFGLIETDGQRMVHIRHGVIDVSDEPDFSARLGLLSESFREILKKHRPHAMSLEKIFLGKNADSAFKLGHARGVLMAEAALAKVSVNEYAARQVKKGVTGSGASSKEETQIVVQNLLGIHGIQRIDASDALALACYHAFETRKASLLRRGLEI